MAESPSDHPEKTVLEIDAAGYTVKVPYSRLYQWRQKVAAQGVKYVELFMQEIDLPFMNIKEDKQATIERRMVLIGNYIKKKLYASKQKKENFFQGRYYNCFLEKNDVVDLHRINQSTMEELERVKEELVQAKDERDEWAAKHQNLQQEKERLFVELQEAVQGMEENLQAEQENSKTLGHYLQQLLQYERANDNTALVAELNELKQEMHKAQQERDALRNTGQPYHQVDRRQKKRKLSVLKTRAEKALWFLQSFGLEVASITLKSQDGEQVELATAEKKRGTYESLSEQEKENVEKVLFLLDKFCASDELYHEMVQVSPSAGLPKLYIVKQRRNELNAHLLSEIRRTPGPFTGAQRSLKHSIRDQVTEELKGNPDKTKMKIKLSADGAKMSRLSNFVMVSHSLLDNDRDVMASKGQATVAIVDCKENYDNMAVSLHDFFNEVNDLVNHPTIEVNGTNVEIELFLGGDMKLLLIWLGLNAAHADYACIWCKIHKDWRHDMDLSADYYETGKIKRTIEELINEKAEEGSAREMGPLRQSGRQARGKKYGQKRKPFINVPLDHVMLDELHLMLRITDVLTGNLILEAMERDSKEGNKNILKGKRLDALVKAIQKCGVSFQVWEKADGEGSGSGKYEWTSLMGKDKKKLLDGLPSRLDETILFPETAGTVVKLWKDFKSFYDDLNGSTFNEDHRKIGQKARDWIKTFTSLRRARKGYDLARVTPYMHAMAYHLESMIRRHGSIKKFTGQGVEKLNDDARKVTTRHSNGWNACVDALLWKGRQQVLKDRERQTHQYEKIATTYWTDGIFLARQKQRAAARLECSSDDDDDDAQPPCKK